MVCVLCGGNGSVPVVRTGAWSYVACAGCGLVRVDPFPTPEEAGRLYGDAYFDEGANAGYAGYVDDAAVHRRNGRARVRRLGPVGPTPLLVDVGCAYGYTMDAAAAVGWSPSGVEVNGAARAHVRSLGMACEGSFAELDVAPCSLGAVTFLQSLEHLTDPVSAMRAAADALAPGGTVMIETWDRRSRTARVMGGRWQQLSPPSVLWLFDEPGLRAIGEEVGLTMTSFRRTPKWVTLGLVAGQIGGRGGNGPLVSALRPLRKVAVPYALDDLVTVTLRRVTGG